MTTITKVATALRRDLREIRRLIESHRFEQILYLIVAKPGCPIDEFHEIFSAQDYLSGKIEHEDLPSLSDLVPNESTRKVFYINCIVAPDKVDNHVEPIISDCCSYMSTRANLSFVLFIDEFSLNRLPGWLEKNNIPNHFFQYYFLGQVDEQDFILWFKEQFPIRIHHKILSLLIHGTGTNFSNAIAVRDAFYDHINPKQFFLTEDNEVLHTAIFTKTGRKYVLQSEEGAEIRIPSGFYLFDTSGIISTDLPAFLTQIGDGEWINPKIVIDELHRFEETNKRDSKMRTSVSRMKSNLKLIDEKLKQKVHAMLRNYLEAEDPDLKIISIARETGAIIVTADEMIFLNCKSSRVPVVLFR